MELVSKSLDEITTEICDVYDGLIAPKRTWRNNNNKLYLIFRACAAGAKLILDAAIALRNRFDPRHCSNADLHSTALLVGTEYKAGTGSIVRITARNKNIALGKALAKGIYNYASVTGMVFSFELANDTLFDPAESKVISAISKEKGSYPVGNNASIKLARADGEAIDSAFVFSCEDNTGQLGYTDEDDFVFRQRILNDADRQDHIKELELKIRNLPNIFECNLKLNQDVQPLEYDGITLAPMELLVVITGVPTNEIARLVATDVLYATHQVDPARVVYYENEYYVGGKYPVYFTYHETKDFSLEITYQYDRQKLKSSQVEEEINRLLDQYTHAVVHVDTISEKAIYSILSAVQLPNVTILDVNLMVDDEQVPYLRIPSTRLPHLTGIIYSPVEEGGVS